MSKILITSLGTGRKDKGGYQTTDYEIEGKTYKKESIIAKTYCDHYKIDKIFIIGTKKSSWEDLYLRFNGDEDTWCMLNDKIKKGSLSDKDLQVIENQIDTYIGKEGSKCFLIDYGLNQSELLKNFGFYLQMANHINKKDEIYLDITHSFRSLAMMSFVMVNYLWELKSTDIKLSKVLYAMLEYEGSIKPVIDLSIFFSLMQWIKAISNLKNFGNAQLLSNLTSKHTTTVANSIRELADSFSLNRLANIREIIKKLQHNSSLIKELQNDPLTLPIAKDLESIINSFDTDRISKFQFDLAKWYYHNKAYGLAYLCLTESIISRTCELLGLPATNYDNRENAKNFLKENPDHSDVSAAVKNYYNEIRVIRDSIAHQTNGQIIGNQSIILKNKDFIEKIQYGINLLENFIK